MRLSLKDIYIGGFGNGYSVDLRDMVEVPRPVLKAYCTSMACCSYKQRSYAKNGNVRVANLLRAQALKLGVGLQTVDCPDCSSALVWKS